MAVFFAYAHGLNNVLISIPDKEIGFRWSDCYIKLHGMDHILAVYNAKKLGKYWREQPHRRPNCLGWISVQKYVDVVWNGNMEQFRQEMKSKGEGNFNFLLKPKRA